MFKNLKILNFTYHSTILSVIDLSNHIDLISSIIYRSIQLIYKYNTNTTIIS